MGDPGQYSRFNDNKMADKEDTPPDSSDSISSFSISSLNLDVDSISSLLSNSSDDEDKDDDD